MQLNIGGSDWILTAEVEWAIKFLMNLLFGIIWCSSYAQFGQFANMASSTLLFVSFWQDPISLWGLPCFLAHQDVLSSPSTSSAADLESFL